jgi:hypothetical protein
MAGVKVTANMLTAVRAQTELLDTVAACAGKLAKEILGRDVIVRKNFWGSWISRSVLISFNILSTDKRRGFHPYAWLIHYYSPEILEFANKPSKTAKTWNRKIQKLNLAEEFFFTLDDEQKQATLEQFVRQNLNAIKEEIKQY